MCVISNTRFFYGMPSILEYRPMPKKVKTEPKPQGLVKTNVCDGKAKVAKIGKEHGYFEFWIPEAQHLKSTTKNGALVLPTNNGKLFFHAAEVRMPMEEVKVGMTFSFDVVHVKTTNMYVATSVQQSSPLPEPINVTSVCAHQCGKVIRLIKDGGLIDFQIPSRFHQVSITKNGARAFPENSGLLAFHSSEYRGPMTELKLDDLVRFNVVHNKTSNKYLAENMSKIIPEITTTVKPRDLGSVDFLSSIMKPKHNKKRRSSIKLVDKLVEKVVEKVRETEKVRRLSIDITSSFDTMNLSL